MTQTLFHPGERAAQALAGVASPNAAIRPWMPDQHRSFFGLLPFLPIATADPDGAPVATILTGAPGFITSPDPTTLLIAAHPDPADPAASLYRPGAQVGILGIDLATRRRNRANGTIRSATSEGLDITISQSFGNCPRYIQTRVWEEATRQAGPVEVLSKLDASARAAVIAADAVFVATTSGSRAEANGGIDISHRGGRPGFIAADGDTLIIPDFNGNHYFNTFGNLLLDPRAALLLVDWASGSLLHLSGTAEILWDATGDFPGAERLWRMSITSGWRRPAAIPLRWSFGDFAPQTLRTGTWSSARSVMMESG